MLYALVATDTSLVMATRTERLWTSEDGSEVRNELGVELGLLSGLAVFPRLLRRSID